MKSISATSVIIAALIAASPGAQPPREWSQWRGPARDGTVAFAAPATWPGALTKQWEVTVGAGHSSPVVTDGRVIIHTRQGEREVTRALDLHTGKELWRIDYAAPYTMNSAARGHGPGPKSTPVVAAGRVFTFGISGILTAHDVATGKVLWRTDAPPAPPEFGTAMSPLVDGSLVIAHVGAHDRGALTAFDVASGTPRWRWTGDGPAYASPVLAEIDGRRQLVTQSENAVIGVDAANGQLLWRLPFRTSHDQNSVTPVVVNDVVIFSGLDNGTAAVRVVRKGAAWTAEPLWKNDQVSMYMSSPVVIGRTLFGLSHRNRGQFFAIDVASGRTLWTSPGREGENAALIAAGDLLLLSTTNAELIVARAGSDQFDEVKRYDTAESAVWAHPAIAGTTIVVKDIDKLICWRV
ncbi:MAG TPA: PQQ-binding-like beta-propeller repeat protein [Vicinamibacterales bacterium]|nr:PQQ-binding-like beta-propeller repeat protein [Vicinamibacterales bacterium]